MLVHLTFPEQNSLPVPQCACKNQGLDNFAWKSGQTFGLLSANVSFDAMQLGKSAVSETCCICKVCLGLMMQNMLLDKAIFLSSYMVNSLEMTLCLSGLTPSISFETGNGLVVRRHTSRDCMNEFKLKQLCTFKEDINKFC